MSGHDECDGTEDILNGMMASTVDKVMLLENTVKSFLFKFGLNDYF